MNTTNISPVFYDKSNKWIVVVTTETEEVLGFPNYEQAYKAYERKCDENGIAASVDLGFKEELESKKYDDESGSTLATITLISNKVAPLL